MKALILIPLMFTSFCAPQPTQGVIPVNEDSQSEVSEFNALMNKLNSIESKVDQNLTVTKSVKQDTSMLTESQVKLLEALSGLKESNKENATSIVDAIKSTKVASVTPSPSQSKVIIQGPTIQKTITRSSYRSVSSPRYNLNGSWTRVRSRPDLINHLSGAGSEHRYARSWLNTLTINQLWAVHDDSHVSGAMSGVQPVPISPPITSPAPSPSPPISDCPGGICPNKGSRRFLLFPNARWNR